MGNLMGCKHYMVVNFAELPFPDVILPVLAFSTFVKGDHLFELGPEDVQATELYPDLEFTTLSSVLDTMV
jgi:hypothetical protein